MASRLWLLSLEINKEEDKSTKNEDSEENESEEKIILQKIVLPDLPSLTKDDRYLLFSLSIM